MSGQASSVEMSGTANTIITGQLTVNAGRNTAVDKFLCSSVLIKADEHNTGNVYVGMQGVSTHTGFKLAAAQGQEFRTKDSSKVWLAADQDGQLVYYLIEA